jgi:hypothetical protein
MSKDNTISSTLDIKIIPKLPPSPPSEPELKEEKKIEFTPLPKLLIKTPSYNAFLNAVKLASELNQKVQEGSYQSPSLMSTDEHSDLDATSPKLKFGSVNINEYIPPSPESFSKSPN